MKKLSLAQRDALHFLVVNGPAQIKVRTTRTLVAAGLIEIAPGWDMDKEAALGGWVKATITEKGKKEA